MESVTLPISADNCEFTVVIIIINPISSFRKEIPLLNLLNRTLNKAGQQYFFVFLMDLRPLGDNLHISRLTYDSGQVFTTKSNSK